MGIEKSKKKPPEKRKSHAFIHCQKDGERGGGRASGLGDTLATSSSAVRVPLCVKGGAKV